MNVHSIVIALSVFTVGACVTSSNKCPTGFEYVAANDYCAGLDGGEDAAPADAGHGADTASSEAGSAEGGADAAGDDASTGLGAPCTSTSQCTGAANYCVVAPGATTGFCSITNCTAAECASAYACCDCTASSLPSLQSYPPNVCIKAASEATVKALGCTCM